MKLETKRLELIPLEPRLLRLWVEDLLLFEKELDCVYRAEPLEGGFLDIVKGQLAITENDPENYLWYSFWLIVRKSDRVAVGSADFKRPPDESGAVEIGYGLGEEFEHNGYMTETVDGMCRWALGQPSVSRVIAETECGNSASQHVLTRCGFSLYRQGDTLWWELRRA